jgi:hypothetical protein
LYRLSRLVKRGGVGQEPLPAPFASWTERGMRIRRNSLHLWAGPSASFKTMIILNAIMNMKVPTLMFSSDSDESTIASRMLGILTGTPIDKTEEWLSPTSGELEKAAQLLEPLDYIRWDFSPNPTLDDVWNATYAYATVEGCWPQQIVVDIASDVYLDGHKDEWSMLKELMRQGKVLARETGAAVHMVHHVSDAWKPTLERPVPSRGDVLGKLSGIPVLMVNFAPGGDGEVLAACVKNRFAKCDPSGKTFLRMSVNPATGLVSDYMPGLRPAAQGGEWWQQN